MLEYLRKEKHYVPWAEASRQISYLDVFLQETNVYDKFKVMYYCSLGDNLIVIANRGNVFDKSPSSCNLFSSSSINN